MVVDLFLRAADSLRRKCPERRFRFVWAGGGYAPEKNHLSRMYAAEIEMLGLGDVLDIVGPVEFMDRFYALSDLFLLPSVLDPLPGVVIEAMSHRLPVICFDGASGFPEMFRAEGLDGFCIARCLDAEDMAEKASDLARDDEARKRLGEALYAFYVRTFDMSAYVGRICEVASGARARYADFLSRHEQCGRDRFLLALRAESAQREGILNSSVTQAATQDCRAMTPTLFGLEARIEDSKNLMSAELCNLVGGNTGNLAFNYAIVQELRQRPEVRPWHDRGPGLGIGIISCANQLGQHCNMADALSWPWLTKLDFPVVAIGLGAQSRKKTGPGVLDYETPYLHPATVEWVRRMVEHAPSEHPNISVRGEFTRRVMEELGFGKNVEALGCPTLFISPDVGLGESIARKCGRFDRIALAAGQKGWTSIAPLENSLAKIITACDGAFVAQADVSMIQTARGGYTELDDRTRDGIRRHFRADLDEGQFAEWCKRFGHVFFDVKEWMGFYRQFDFVIGPRIHGTMLALQAGVPAMCIAIDSRTTELCEIMKVPYVSAEAVKDGVSLEQIKRLFRFDPQEFDRNRIMLARRFSKFLANNKLIPSASLAAIAARRSA